MITRFVFAKLKDSATRDHVVSAARVAFSNIAVVRGAEVMTPADADAGVWDLCAVLRFDSLDDVRTYIDDPIHVAFVNDVLAPNTEVKKAWNFQS